MIVLKNKSTKDWYNNDCLMSMNENVKFAILYDSDVLMA